MNNELPLGRETDYPDTYTPGLLAPVPRQLGREPIGLGDSLPFVGEDIWNAWELTWLAPGGRPVIAAAEIRVPATSPNIVESKSLKLYLNSFAMSEFSSTDELVRTIEQDLSAAAGGAVALSLFDSTSEASMPVGEQGRCLDEMAIDCSYTDDVQDCLTTTDDGAVAETLYTNLFRSLCPVTGQPDYATVAISYQGRKIDEASLLRYLLSFRRHQDFHETCVERMFVDIQQSCQPDTLSVSARFLRRGGIDINPMRSNVASEFDNQRHWRQ